jgi:hypothetical protein
MNERIQELMLMAFQEHYGDPITPGAREKAVELVSGWGEKFAELIVREMCQVINDDCQLQMRQRIITNLGGLNQARELIKQHFGVEE